MRCSVGRSDVCSSCRALARSLGALLRGLLRGYAVFHSLIVHREDGQPVQLEDRWVNPAAAPDYLSQDFTAITPHQYLQATAPLSEAEHVVMAAMPTAERSEEHTSELQSLMRISYAVFCLKKKTEHYTLTPKKT